MVVGRSSKARLYDPVATSQRKRLARLTLGRQLGQGLTFGK